MMNSTLQFDFILQLIQSVLCPFLQLVVKQIWSVNTNHQKPEKY
jgi:hypothetical protein